MKHLFVPPQDEILAIPACFGKYRSGCKFRPVWIYTIWKVKKCMNWVGNVRKLRARERVKGSSRSIRVEERKNEDWGRLLKVENKESQIRDDEEKLELKIRWSWSVWRRWRNKNPKEKQKIEKYKKCGGERLRKNEKRKVKV